MVAATYSSGLTEDQLSPLAAKAGRDFCDGFRIPANADLSIGTRLGVRKPPADVAQTSQMFAAGSAITRSRRTAPDATR
jgi:hypothetical protein